MTSYQIEAQRVARRFEQMVGEGNPAVQLVMPMAEIMGWLQQGILQAGLQLIQPLMKEEVLELVGQLSGGADRVSVWPRKGFCVVMEQKVPI